MVMLIVKGFPSHYRPYSTATKIRDVFRKYGEVERVCIAVPEQHSGHNAAGGMVAYVVME